MDNGDARGSDKSQDGAGAESEDGPADGDSASDTCTVDLVSSSDESEELSSNDSLWQGMEDDEGNVASESASGTNYPKAVIVDRVCLVRARLRKRMKRKAHDSTYMAPSDDEDSDSGTITLDSDDGEKKSDSEDSLLEALAIRALTGNKPELQKRRRRDIDKSDKDDLDKAGQSGH